jgi:hypothetical protein
MPPRSWRGSSVVEQRPEKPCVGGSIPLLATIKVPSKNSSLKKKSFFVDISVTIILLIHFM